VLPKAFLCWLDVICSKHGSAGPIRSCDTHFLFDASRDPRHQIFAASGRRQSSPVFLTAAIRSHAGGLVMLQLPIRAWPLDGGKDGSVCGVELPWTAA
jgi:hypothetical protein